MDNDAEALISQQETTENLRRKGGYFIISGILYGFPDADSTSEIGIGGITIEISGKFKSQNIISGVNGEFSSDLFPSGEYTFSVHDPYGKYFQKSFKIKLLQDIYFPVFVSFLGKRRRKNFLRLREAYKYRIAGSVLTRTKKPISGVEISIKSIHIDSNLFSKLISKISLFPKREKDEKKTISIKLISDHLGTFFSGDLPNGSYILKCTDSNGKYKFSSKFIVLKGILPHIVFTGYDSSDLEELKKKLEERKEEAPKETQPTQERTEEKEVTNKPKTEGDGKESIEKAAPQTGQEKQREELNNIVSSEITETPEKTSFGQQIPKMPKEEAPPSISLSIRTPAPKTSDFQATPIKISETAAVPKIEIPVIRNAPIINIINPPTSPANAFSNTVMKGSSSMFNSGLKATGNGLNKAIDTANTGIRGAKFFFTAARTIAMAGTNPGIWIAAGIGILLFLLFFFFDGGGGFSLPEAKVARGNNMGGGGGAPPSGGPPSSALVSCPVVGGTISTHSFKADPGNGHCSISYGACDPNSRRAKSIDVPTGGENIILPTIQGQTANWTYVNHFQLQVTDCENPVNNSCGNELVFVNNIDNTHNWTLFIAHIGFTGMTPGQTYPSGTIVGSSAIDHVHISIGKDVPDPTSMPAGSTDLRSGWMAADAEAGMCGYTAIPPGGICPIGSLYCSPAYLNTFFNDPVVAQKASIICQRESGSDPGVINKNCGTNDYSVGLFQINLVAHCPGAYGAGAWGPQSCDNLLSLEKRNACEAQLLDPVENIKKAVEIYNSWGSFKPWSTAAACNIQ